MTAQGQTLDPTLLAAVDYSVIIVVLFALAIGVFLAIWAIARNSVSPHEMAQVTVRLGTVEASVESVSGRLREVEDKISHLPTIEHVHGLDVRLERVTTQVEAVLGQTGRIYDHLMAHAAPNNGHSE